MMLKLVGVSSLAGMAVVGAVALANAAPNPSSPLPYMTNMTTSTTTTSNPPPYSGRMGY